MPDMPDPLASLPPGYQIVGAPPPQAAAPSAPSPQADPSASLPPGYQIVGQPPAQATPPPAQGGAGNLFSTIANSNSPHELYDAATKAYVIGDPAFTHIGDVAKAKADTLFGSQINNFVTFDKDGTPSLTEKGAAIIKSKKALETLGTNLQSATIDPNTGNVSNVRYGSGVLQGMTDKAFATAPPALAGQTAFAQEAGTNAAKPAVLVPFFDKSNPMAPAVMVDTAHATGSGGVPGYSQIGAGYVTKEGQGAGAAAQIGADKVVRDEAATNQSMIGRQGATLDIAANLQNDPTLKLGSWDKLSLPARNFLQSVGMNPLSDPNPQQAYEAVLSRLTFQEAPTLNVKTVRSGMLPLMNQVQGELGTNPNASRATMLIGKTMQGWDLNRIAAINKSTNAVQAENDYIAQNPVVNPGFKTMLDNTLHPESFSVPKSNVHDFQEWATKYQPFMTPAQRNQVGTILDNFSKGINNTGKTFKLGVGN